MVYGGNVTVFIEPGKQMPYLYLCGCGHVAQAVLPLAKALGYSETQLKEVHAPIGLDLGGESPAEVAFSIMAQVQAHRYQKPGHQKIFC